MPILIRPILHQHFIPISIKFENSLNAPYGVSVDKVALHPTCLDKCVGKDPIGITKPPAGQGSDLVATKWLGVR